MAVHGKHSTGAGSRQPYSQNLRVEALDYHAEAQLLTYEDLRDLGLVPVPEHELAGFSLGG